MERLDLTKCVAKGIIYGLMGLAIYGLNSRGKKEYKKFHNNPKVIQVDSTYNHQKDSLENIYKFKLDSLESDYQMKLNKLEKELKWV